MRVDGDLRVRVELALALGVERDVLLAEDGLHPDRGTGLRAEARVLGDREVDADVAALEVDARHLADLDAGDAHVVVGLDAAGLREGRAVCRPAADDRQAGRVEGQVEQHGDDEQADRADRDRVALSEGDAHRLAPRRRDVVGGADAGQDRAPRVELAEVEVEPRAVGRRAGQGGDAARGAGDEVLELLDVPRLVEGRGESPQLGDVVLDERSRRDEQVGGLGGERVDAGQRTADRLAVGSEPAREPLELVDEREQLLVVGVDRAEHGVEVVDGAADDGVAVGERGREAGRLGEQGVHVAALPLQGLDEQARELVDVARGQRGEERLEAVEEHGEVEGGVGARRAGSSSRRPGPPARPRPGTARGSAGRRGCGT